MLRVVPWISTAIPLDVNRPCLHGLLSRIYVKILTCSLRDDMILALQYNSVPYMMFIFLLAYCALLVNEYACDESLNDGMPLLICVDDSCEKVNWKKRYPCYIHTLISLSLSLSLL